MLQENAMKNGVSKEDVQEVVNKDMSKAFGLLKSALIAWNYMLEDEVQDSFKYTADLIGIMFNDLEDKLVAKNFGTNTEFADAKIKDYPRMDLATKWAAFCTGRYRRAGTKATNYINLYLEAIKAKNDLNLLEDKNDPKARGWAQSREAFITAWNKVKNNWSFSYSFGDSDADEDTDIPTDMPI